MDATGKIPDGTEFHDIREFKQILLKDKQSIARGLTEKLVTYALGRQVGFSDRRAIERVVARVAGNGYGFRALVHQIVQSEMFRSP